MLGSLWERGKLKLAVDSATSTADDPTPIYVLDELVQELGAGDSRAGVDAVCARLAHRSPVVKQKALKVVAHIGRKGSPDLRRLMARHGGAVRDLLHFRCDPDPFKGDTVWKRVQEYAQEALNAIHGEPEAAAPSSSGLRGRIQGFGSDAAGGYSSGGVMMGFGSESAGGYSGGGGGSSGRMVGFGSADVMQSGMQAISSGMRTLSGGRYDDYSGAQLDGGGYSGGYGGSGGSRAGAGGLAQGPIVQAGAVAPPAAPASSSAAPGASSSGGAAEQRAVERICTPAGLRTAPSREDLRTFVDTIAALDGAAVAQLLQRKLEAGPWQASLRALCAIEAALESSSQAACGQVAAHFKAHPDVVRAAAESPQASVRQRAQKLLGALVGGAAAPAAPGSDNTAASQQPLFTEDLLGEAEGSGSAPSTSAAGLADLLGEAPAPASSSANAGVDLLAGLDVPAAAAAPTQPPAQPSAAAAAAAAGGAAADDLFGGMLLDSQPGSSMAGGMAPLAASAVAAPVLASTSPLDLLGGLSLGGPGISAAAPAPAAAALPAPSAAAPGFDDLLGGLSLGAAPAVPAMGAARANGAASGAPMQPATGMVGTPLGGGSMGWGGAMQPLGGVPAGSVQQGAALGGMSSHGPFHQSGPAGVGDLQGLHYGRPPAQPPARLPSLGSLGSGPLPDGALAHSGILDSSRDNAFNFVDDALAAAKRKQ